MKTAMFSILAPHKHIPDHCGPYKGIVRYHLALKVPEPRDQCRIRVGDEIVTWEEGRSLIFDDTYEHEVWNDTDGERVVLFVDVVRPLRFPMNLVNAGVIWAIAHSPFILDAKRRHLAWEERFAAARRAGLPQLPRRPRRSLPLVVRGMNPAGTSSTTSAGSPASASRARSVSTTSPARALLSAIPRAARHAPLRPDVTERDEPGPAARPRCPGPRARSPPRPRAGRCG